MKIIIDIPEESYKYIKTMSDQGWLASPEYANTIKLTASEYANAIKNSTPLKDVKAEIEKLDEGITSYDHDNPWVYKSEVLMILDNIGKAESERI